jgi:hypothetical protein
MLRAVPLTRTKVAATGLNHHFQGFVLGHDHCVNGMNYAITSVYIGHDNG